MGVSSDYRGRGASLAPPPPTAILTSTRDRAGQTQLLGRPSLAPPCGFLRLFPGEASLSSRKWDPFLCVGLTHLVGGKICLQRKSYSGNEKSDGVAAADGGSDGGKRSCPHGRGVSALGAGAGVPVRGCECSEVSAEAGRPLLLQPGGFCFENENPGARGTLKASRFRSHFRLSPHPRSRFMGCFLFVFKLYNNIFFSVRARSHLRAFHMSRPCLDRPPTHPHHFTSP